MGLEDCSDEEFESRLESGRKKRLKNIVLKAAAIIAGTAGLCAFAGYAMCTRAEEIRDYAIQEPLLMPPNEAIARLVAEISTPEEAFEKINTEIEFFQNHDEKANLRRDYWASLQETWQRKTGDCEDGAIAFKALLSDNPEYDVKIALLAPDIENSANYAISCPEFSDGQFCNESNTTNRIAHISREKIAEKHIIAVYRSNNNFGLWGYVSFNNLESNGIIENPLFGSMESAISGFNSSGEYESYAVIDFTDEELKFGAELTRGTEDLQMNPIPKMCVIIKTPVIEGYI